MDATENKSRSGLLSDLLMEVGSCVPQQTIKSLEISRMLTVSSAHVAEETMEMLSTEPESNRFPFLMVYPKADYGCFIYLIQGNETLDKGLDLLPGDLRQCVELTLRTDCTILCLDCDGPVVDGLLQHDW